MELLQLRYFYESSKNESFAKTAEKYFVPASPVSASIKRLEQELGCKLFDRESNRIILNESGKTLQKSCLAIFEELDSSVAKLTNAPEQYTEIRLLIISFKERLINAMIAYQKTHPNIRFNSTFNIKNTDVSQYDIIIDKDVSKYEEHKKIELGSYQLCFKTTPDSPLVGRDLRMSDLRHQSFVTMESENELNSVLFESCRAAGFSPNVVVYTNDQQYYKSATQAGLGISLWRKYNTPSHDNLVNISVSDFNARQTIYMYYKSALMNSALAEFIDFLRKTEF